MRLAIVDLEMAQPNNEIVEIGACLWDCRNPSQQGRGQQFHSYVKPLTYDSLPEDLGPCNKINKSVAELTGITKSFLVNAPSPDVALTQFWQWLEELKCGNRLGAWGAGDVPALVRDSKAAGVEAPRNLKEINLKWIGVLARSAYPKSCKAQGGLDSTMALLGLQFEGKPHRALDDAVNTGRVLQRAWDMLNKYMLMERLVNGPK